MFHYIKKDAWLNKNYPRITNYILVLFIFVRYIILYLILGLIITNLINPFFNYILSYILKMEGDDGNNPGPSDNINPSDGPEPGVDLTGMMMICII